MILKDHPEGPDYTLLYTPLHEIINFLCVFQATALAASLAPDFLTCSRCVCVGHSEVHTKGVSLVLAIRRQILCCGHWFRACAAVAACRSAIPTSKPHQGRKTRGKCRLQGSLSILCRWFLSPSHTCDHPPIEECDQADFPLCCIIRDVPLLWWVSKAFNGCVQPVPMDIDSGQAAAADRPVTIAAAGTDAPDTARASLGTEKTNEATTPSAANTAAAPSDPVTLRSSH